MISLLNSIKDINLISKNGCLLQTKNLERDKKSFILHPFLFASLPVLFLLAFNAHELPIFDVIIPISISIIATFSLWLLLRYFVGGAKSGLLLSLFILLFTLYGHLRNELRTSDDELLQFLGSHYVLGVIFFIIAVIGPFFFLRTKSDYELNSIFNVIAITIVGILIFNVALYYVSNPSDVGQFDFEGIPLIVNDIEQKPDVYVIILDEFAGEKQLEIDFDFDLTPFNNELKKRDFLVPDVSLSNYPNTEFSMPSHLNMIYLDQLATKLGPESNDKSIPIKLTNQNYVMQMFSAYDYQITTFYGGIGAIGDTLIVDEKLCSYGTINTDLRKNFVLTYWPVTYFSSILLDDFQYDKLDCIFSYLTNVEDDSSHPHLVFAHLRLPHEPFIFDSEGNRVSSDPSLKVDKSSYLEQLIFTQKKTLEIIDSIQKNSPDSVIILYSDHGYRPEINWEDPSDVDLIRGFNVISALHFPNEELPALDKLSLVNLYRIFFNTYFETDYEILADLHLWYEPDSPYVHVDVTEKLNLLI